MQTEKEKSHAGKHYKAFGKELFEERQYAKEVSVSPVRALDTKEYEEILQEVKLR